MNIAIVTPDSLQYANWGGVGTIANHLSKLLASRGHHVFFFTYSKLPVQTKTTRYKSGKISIIPVASDQIFLNNLLPYTSFAYSWNKALAPTFDKVHRRHPIAVIHSTSLHAPGIFIATKHHHIPIILHDQGLQRHTNPFQRSSIDLYLKSLFDEYFIRFYPQRIVACSDYEQKLLVDTLPKVSAKTTVVPNFLIDTTKYQNKQKLNINNLVYFGRLETRKGVDILLKAFQSLALKNSDLRLYLIGSSSQTFKHNGRLIDFKDYLKSLNLSRSISKRITVKSHIKNRVDLIKYLASIKGLAVFPAKHEPFGYVMIEAMAMGFIPLASRFTGAIQHIKSGNNGFIITPNYKKLAKIIELVQKMPQIRLTSISNQSQETVTRHYSATAVTKPYQSIYHQLKLKL